MMDLTFFSRLTFYALRLLTAVMVSALGQVSAMADPIPASVFTELVPGEPDRERLIPQGQTFFMQGQFERAQSCFNSYVQLHPQDPTGYFWIGRAAQQNGQNEQAARYYAHSETLAKQLGMDSDQLRVNLGNSLLKLNYFKEAIYDYERAIRINDKNIFAHFNLGKALLLTGQSNRALNEISKASELGYTDPSASLMRALALKNLGQLDESKREAQRFLDDPSVSPTSPLRDIAKSLL